jgi:hypothetical protein
MEVLCMSTLFRCPKCGTIVGSTSGVSDKMWDVGPEWVVCPKCWSPVKTGGAEWVNMTESHRQLFWFGQHVATALFYGPLMAFLPARGLTWVASKLMGTQFEDSTYMAIFVVLWLIAWVLLVLQAHRVYKERIRDSLKRKPNPN